MKGLSLLVLLSLTGLYAMDCPTVQRKNAAHNAMGLQVVLCDQSHQDLDAECSICLDIIGDDDRARADDYTTHCKHSFHADCLQSWINVKAECPNCRALFTSGNEPGFIAEGECVPEVGCFNASRYGAILYHKMVALMYELTS